MTVSAFDPRPRNVFGRLRQAARDRPLLMVFGLLVAVSLVFLAVPRLDLVVSHLFYDPRDHFNEDGTPLMVFLRESGHIAEWIVGLAVAVPLLVKILAPESRLLLRPRVTLFMLGTLALGPGLLVNGILKEFWGRARPRELLEFGEDAMFSPIWWISDQCGRNCSFVSGEAAAAFWLVALAFVVPKAWRLPTAIATLAFAAAVSFTRIAMGGHFLSDVIVAWLLTLLVIVALQRLVLKGLPETFDSTVEDAAWRYGRALRRWWAQRAGPPSA
jgi:membrane-associated phospholipid phosphatase